MCPGPALLSDGGHRMAPPRNTGGSRCASFSRGLVPSRSRRSSSMRARIVAKSSAARGRFTSAPPISVIVSWPGRSIAGSRGADMVARGEMRPRAAYCRRASCPGKPSIAHLSFVASTERGLSGPQCPQRPFRPGRGRLMGKEVGAPFTRPNAPGTCIMTSARTSANDGVPLASWRPRRSLPNPTLE
jgi:hypothetical protein